jgi:hypothetical protein
MEERQNIFDNNGRKSKYIRQQQNNGKIYLTTTKEWQNIFDNNGRTSKYLTTTEECHTIFDNNHPKQIVLVEKLCIKSFCKGIGSSIFQIKFLAFLSLC